MLHHVSGGDLRPAYPDRSLFLLPRQEKKAFVCGGGRGRGSLLASGVGSREGSLGFPSGWLAQPIGQLFTSPIIIFLEFPIKVVFETRF